MSGPRSHGWEGVKPFLEASVSDSVSHDPKHGGIRTRNEVISQQLVKPADCAGTTAVRSPVKYNKR